MKSNLLAIGVLLLACNNSSDPSPKPVSNWRRDAIAIPAGEFLGKRMFCDVPASFSFDGDLLTLVPLTTAAYAIDRTTVDCASYRECVGAKRCQALPDLAVWGGGKMGCIEDRAIVRRSAAAAYCAFRGGRVQSAHEWQRAVRGTTGRRYPPGMSFEINPEDCPHPTREDKLWPRCVYTSETGVVFTRFDRAGYELARDTDCWDPISREPTQRFGDIFLDNEQLDPSVNHEDIVGLIRCTYQR